MLKKDTKHGNVTFKVNSRIKMYAEAYTASIYMDVSSWVTQLAEAYLIEKRVLNEHCELINGWGDPSKIGQKRVIHKTGIDYDTFIGVRIDRTSPVFIGLKHYANGNSSDAPNFSALLRFLVERELRLEEVITKAGNLTAKWAERLERKKQAA